MDGPRTPNLHPGDIADNRLSNAMSYQTASGDSPAADGTSPRRSTEEPLSPPVRPSSGIPPSSYRQSTAFSTAQPNTSFESTQLLAPAAPTFRDSGARESTSLLADKEALTTSSGEVYPPTTAYGDAATKGAKAGKKRFWIFVGGIIALLVVVAVAVAVPVSLHKSNPSSNADHTGGSNGGSSGGGSGSTGNGTTSGGSPTTTGAITGGDGSTVKTENGTTFTYSNKFGGFWVWDPKNPYNSNAQAQSWSKPLNESWDWANDVIRGVNLGGWLVPEPFIAPSLYEPYLNAATPAVDEYTLSQNMAADTANGGLSQLEHHYATFITEEDFAMIAGAGLNWVRLPIPFWAVQTFSTEPYLEGVSWKYVLKAFQWARKYGLRVNLDLHAVPGSQNGYNHSGKGGQVNFLTGIMGIANGQRTLDYLRVIVEFITQPEYTNVVPMLGVVNEALVTTIGMDVLSSFYLLMHDTLRNITGIGEGHGPYFSVHDGFQPLSGWADLLPGKDRFALDTHPYLIFGTMSTAPLAAQLTTPCDNFAATINASWTAFGVTTAGEWSLAINDCGQWINGVGSAAGWETQQGAGACDTWNDYENWSADQKQNFQKLALNWMDAMQHWFFWTWKIGPSSVTGKITSPMWSYSLGLQHGWMPPDPRAATGACGGGSPAGALSPLQTGGAGAGQISDAIREQFAWPPTLSGVKGNSLPSYTPTGSITTLPVATFTGTASNAAITPGNGWFDAGDTRPMYTAIAGCTYPDEYNPGDAVPAACSGAKRGVHGVVPKPRAT